MKKEKVVNKRFDKSYLIKLAILKVLIILFIVGGFYVTNKTRDNTISLLAVQESQDSKIISGSKIDLNLEITKGTGQIFVNLNSIEDIDTQVSILNSQKQACDLFDLDCMNYDFHYTFENSALVLKGPSASAAIAILTAKTLENKKLNSDIVITGALSSSGVIGNVGGVDKKIEVAENFGFKKIIVPIFSNYNKTKSRNITVVPSLDIVTAYNEFSDKIDKINLEEKKLDTKEYKENMLIIADLLCSRTEKLIDEINQLNITKKYLESKVFEFENKTEFSNQYRFYNTELKLFNAAKSSYNNSIFAGENENYYSKASFCYNSNVNYNNILILEKNESLEKIDTNLENLEININSKKFDLQNEYKSKIKTINDFYVYLILNNRIYEARKLAIDGFNLGKSEEEKISDSGIFVIGDDTKNITGENTLDENKTIDNELLKLNKQSLYAQGSERFYSVLVWESLILNQGNLVNINSDKLNYVCHSIINNINLKSEVLKSYGITSFDGEFSKLYDFAKLDSGKYNPYLCIYNGYELSGKIDTILNSVDLKENELSEFADEILKVTNNRLDQKSNPGNFPLIPYIYYEYANELNQVNNSEVAILYANYATNYLNLDYELQNKKYNYLLQSVYRLFDFKSLSIVFVVSLLIVLAFLEHGKKRKKKNKKDN